MFKVLILGLLLALLPMRMGEMRAHIQWAKDALPRYSAYDEFVADAKEQQIRILISVDNTVENFKVLGLEFQDADATGKPVFKEKELYTKKTLTPQRPLVITMTFLGDLPNYGISYLEKQGATMKFAIQQSGEDGSLLLVEIS